MFIVYAGAAAEISEDWQNVTRPTMPKKR